MGGSGKKWGWDSNFNEWMNLAEYLHANTHLRKVKVTSKVMVDMVKYGCILLGHGTLISA